MNYTNKFTKISNILPKVYTNNSMKTMNNQEQILQYQKYLHSIIQNYNELQDGIYQSIKDSPQYQTFYNTISKWVFCENDEKYYHIDFKQLTSKTGFLRIIEPSFSSFTESLPQQIQQKYKKFLKLDKFINLMELIPSIHGFTFDSPNKSPIMFKPNKTLLNTFDHKLITKEKAISTQEEMDAIATVECHIKELIGDNMILDNNNQPTNKHNYEFFMDWIAYQVQHPSKLLRFAPIIQGIQGSGKSFLVYLLKAILCDEYVKTISNEELKNPFNHYATGRIVNVVEEFNVQGKTDNFVLQKMKDFITNDEFVVNKKNMPQYSNPNKTNYLFLTNYKNCLPLEATERRYWIIYSPITYDDLNKFYTNEYFNKLFQTLHHKEALRHYFLNRKISKEFLNYNRAPKTQATNELLELTKTNILGYEEAKELIAEDDKNYNKNIIISNEFFAVLKNRGIKLFNKAKKDLMEALGYTAYNKTFRYDAHQNSRVFIKDTIYTDTIDSLEVRALYENTLINDPGLEFKQDLQLKDNPIAYNH